MNRDHKWDPNSGESKIDLNVLGDFEGFPEKIMVYGVWVGVIEMTPDEPLGIG